MQAGRDLLRPAGLKQRGRSRLWLDDQGWWLGLVELGSPRWSQGSRLRVGVMLLWESTPHIRFDVLHPGRESTDFLDEAQFSQSVRRHCDLAVERLESYRQKLRDITTAARFLRSSMPTRPTPWDHYHAGVAAALTGDAEDARGHFARVFAADDLQWLTDLQDKTRTLTNLMDDHNALRTWASSAVAATRQELNLRPLATEAFPTPHAQNGVR